MVKYARKVMELYRTTNYKHLLIIIAVCLVAFCFNNSYIVPDIMESRNLITAREMIEKGNWLLPTMNDHLRLEKPPLPTWIAAITMMIAGDNWSAFRFVPGLMGMLTVVYLYRLAKQMTNNSLYALCSSLILATSYNFILSCRTASWDIYCHAFMLVSIFYQYQLYSGKEHKWRNATLAGIFLGMSILSKGPVSLYALWLPFVVATVIHSYFTDGLRNKKNLLPTLYFILLGIVIGGSWYGYVWFQQAEAGAMVLTKETGSWVNHNIRPWYYYWSFFTETGIWMPLCIASLAVNHWRKRVGDGKHYLFVFLWMITCLLLLSLLPEKKNRYLLPLLIPASLTMGYLLFLWGKKGQRVLAVVVSVFAVVELLGMPLLASIFSNTRYTCPKSLVAKSYTDIPVYCSSKDTIRIELVYDVGKSVHPINLQDRHLLAASRPFLLILPHDSHETEVPERSGAKYLGTYNGNRQSAMLKKDKQKFHYNLYIYE